MSEQEIQVLLRQILEGQKQLIKEIKEIHRRLERLESKKYPSQLPDKWLEQQEPEAIDLWKKVLTEVKVRISQPSFIAWFQETKAIQIEQDTIIVYSPNQIARDWLDTFYTSLIEDIFFSLSAPVRKVHFVTSEKSDSLPDRHIVPTPVEIPPLTRISEAQEIWSKVCAIIQERISRPSFETWVKPTEARGIHEKKLYISCPNDFARDWLSSRYASLVEECLDTLKIGCSFALDRFEILFGFSDSTVDCNFWLFQHRSVPHGKQ
jgi:hypothetical protein